LLHGFFDRVLDDDGARRIEGLHRTTAGLSRENWVFDLVLGDARQELILRRDPLASLLDTDRATELALLNALEPTPIPSPVVLWSDLEGDLLGRPALVMQRAPGSCDYMVLNGTRPMDDRRRLAEQFCDLLTELHAVDLVQAGIDRLFTDPGEKASLLALEEWTRTLHQRVDAAYPELEAAALWLAERAPASPRSVLVHADFKPGNILLKGDQITALLDWETAHIGDPNEDLGWITQPLRAREHQIPDVWEIDDIIDHYERATGYRVDRGAVAWWRLFASFKSAVITLTGLEEYLAGRSDRLFREPTRFMRVLIDAMRHDDER
jgi:aminoglycoside phosphotransferase (APT) family kinase protein